MAYTAVNVRLNDISNQDIIIAVMGPTGSGKSNFIDVVSNATEKRASDRLQSWTQDVQAIRLRHHKIYGDRLVLVDTPGFDDTTRTDMEILDLIGDWLKKTYKAKITLAGIIYMHRISDNRMAGSPFRNLHMFGELCGDKAVEKVVLVTSMWDKVDQKTAEKRESELIRDYWAQMLQHRASHNRFDNSESSAWKVLEPLISKQHLRQVLLLQEELVDLKKRINETKAALAIYDELLQLLEKQKHAIDKLKEQAEKNPDSAEGIREEQARTQASIDKIFRQINSQKVSFGRKVVLFFKKDTQSHALDLKTSSC